MRDEAGHMAYNCPQPKRERPNPRGTAKMVSSNIKEIMDDPISYLLS